MNNDNKKTSSAGRNIARIVFVLMVIVFIGIFSISIYLGGQMKTIDKFYTAIERGDNKSYLSCISDDAKKYELYQSIDEIQSFTKEKLDMPEDKSFFVKTDFIKRNIMKSTRHEISATVTFYNDTDYYKEIYLFSMKFEHNKWLIDFYTLN